MNLNLMIFLIGSFFSLKKFTLVTWLLISKTQICGLNIYRLYLNKYQTFKSRAPLLVCMIVKKEKKNLFSVPNERLFQDHLIGKFADPFSANLHFSCATFSHPLCRKKFRFLSFPRLVSIAIADCQSTGRTKIFSRCHPTAA